MCSENEEIGWISPSKEYDAVEARADKLESDLERMVDVYNETEGYRYRRRRER